VVPARRDRRHQPGKAGSRVKEIKHLLNAFHGQGYPDNAPAGIGGTVGLHRLDAWALAPRARVRRLTFEVARVLIRR
jgi:hypothetical protein